MSIEPGALKLKDPDSTRNAQFNWSAYLGTTEIAAADVVVTGPDGTLIADSIISSGQLVDYRIHGGTLGKRYKVRCRITTAEESQQIEDRSFNVKIVNG